MPRIYVVDDDKDFAEAVAEVLKLEGYEVELEHDSARALDGVRDLQPDAIVLDVMFPENPSAGFEVARRVREDFPNIPILLLTAVNQEFPLGFSDKDIDSKWLPVAEFLEKPVDFDLLCQKIAKLVN